MVKSNQMHSDCSQKRCGRFLIIGAINIILGTCLLILWPTILNTAIEFGSTLSENSYGTSLWRKNPMPIHLDFYLFNWTNPEEIYNLSSKPRFEEIGPFVFHETKEKVNLTWNKNDTVSFRQYRTWVFDRESSVADLDVNVTSVNPVTVSGSYQARHWGFWMKKGFQFSLGQMAPKIHISKPIGQVLFHGYDDIFVTMSGNLPFLGKLPAMDKFGWFYGRNGSYTFDGLFNMDISTKNYGVLRRWNYEAETNVNPGKCGEVRGSAGELYPAHQNRTKISFFSPDMCRNVILDYEKDEYIKGIKGYKFSAGISMLDNGTLMPDNLCYCNGECVPSGALNVSECRYGTPGFVSLPHFHKADSYYERSMEGLKPDNQKHEFYITLEPTTGIPLSVAARLQLNLLMQPIKYLTTYENVPKVFFPVLWFEQVVEIPDNLTFMLKFLLSVPLICQTLGLALILTGVSLIGYMIYKPIIQLLQQRPLKHPKNISIIKEVEPLTHNVIEKTHRIDDVKKKEDVCLLT